MPTMKPSFFIPSLGALCVLALFTTPARADVVFGPVIAGPGQSVRLVSHTTTEGATIKEEYDGKVSNGKILYSRDRDLSWTFRDPAADGSVRGMVTITKIATVISETSHGKTDKTEDVSPLNGKMFAMNKGVGGDWKFELDGSVPMYRIEKEIAELTLYLKRKWYPDRKIALGESWEFDPTWIRMLIERDFKQAQVIGTMSLRQIRHLPGRDLAVIDVSVRSTGGDFSPDGTEASAQIEISGQLVVNLKTMLDESMELKGTVINRSGRPGNTKTTTLPLKLEVTKTLFNN